MSRRIAVAAGLAVGACGHSDPIPTAPAVQLGPITPTSYQLTFNPLDDYAPSWTPDGLGVIYTFSDPGKITGTDSRCFGIIPPEGGTRTFTFCDTRSTHADSSDSFFGTALRSDGKLLFMQGSGARKFSHASRTVELWLADTTDPLGNRAVLATFPRAIGDSVVDVLTETAWIDSSTFIAVGNRMTYPVDPPKSAYVDTVPRPLYLVRGIVAGTTVTLTQISGTDLAAHWSPMPGGDLLFVKGTLASGATAVATESRIMRVPSQGGAATLFGFAPDGGSLRGVTCGVATCVAVGSLLYRVDLQTGVFNSISLGPSVVFSNWNSPALSPDGGTLIYRVNTTVSNTTCACSRPVGNLFRAGLPVP